MIDTSKVQEFKQSPTRILLRLVGCAVFFFLSLAVGLGLFANFADRGFRQFVGWVGAFFFGLCFLMWTRRALKMGQAILSLSPEGFKDIRISPDWVRWSAVENLSTWSWLGTKIIVAKIPDATWQALELTKLARASLLVNKSVGVDGLAIAAVDLGIKVDDLLSLMRRYRLTNWAVEAERRHKERYNKPITSFSRDLAGGIDYDLTKGDAHVRPYPAPGDVFVPEQVDLSEYMHPLVSIDLAVLNPEWSGFVHIVSPIEPGEGFLGADTKKYHNVFLDENCIILKIENGKYRFMGDKRYFFKAWNKSTVPRSRLSWYEALLEHYDVEERSYRHALALYRQTGNVHRLDAEGNFVFGNREPSLVLEKLGGYSEIWNFYVGMGLEAERSRNPTENGEISGDFIVPYSKAGRPFQHVASVPGWSYRNSGADSIVLFYEPVEKLALITFDWT